MAKINIVGHIGPSQVDQAGMLHKGTVLLDVIEQVESFPNDLELEINVNSPGGFADIGDSIYDYLVSLKAKGKKITTVQTGLIGSIATKIFLAGDRRIVDDRYQFWIHNPYIGPNEGGDQEAFKEMAAGLQKTENDLIKFYAEYSSITEVGLDALMKLETGLTADQCIKFGFATEKKLIPVFNSIKKTMEKTFIEKVFGTKKGVQPKTKAAMPDNKTKAMVVNLADDGGSFWVEGELAEGSAAFLLDEAGEPTAEPLADGDYVLEDGTSLSVAGGMVTAVVPAEEAEASAEGAAPGISPEQLAEMIAAEVAKALAQRDEAQAKLDEEKLKAEETKVNELVESKILALKKDIKLGIQPKRAVLVNNEPENKRKSIHMIMAEKRENRKQQLNGK
jgi:ATP-dependent protease ClpP protease subunit